MNASPEVVITGLGVVSPLGIGIDTYIESLRQGRSAVEHLSPYAEQGMSPHIGSRVHDFDPEKFVHRKTLKVMSREIQSAYAATDLALKHAGLAKGAVDPDRIGIVLGSEMLYGKIDELADAFRHCTSDQKFHFEQWGKAAMHDIFPLWMLKYLPNMAACHVGIAHDARGPNNTITQGENSSLMAVMEAASYIQRGLADVAIAGGTGSRISEAALPFRGTVDVSLSNADPKTVSRPFDARRSGMVIGEGAGSLVLESREHAQRRGAKIWGRVAGFASRTEPGHREEMTGLSISNAIRGALQMAGLKPTDIGHVNANGMSTLRDDRIEATAIAQTLGDVPVTALKSYFGYLGAGSGAIELAASVWSLNAGEIPRTLNYDNPDPACDIRVVHGQSLTGRRPVAIKLNHTPIGQAAAVVITAA
jgi:3-oxoacyl-[acyl-carrier-protein] synthase II